MTCPHDYNKDGRTPFISKNMALKFTAPSIAMIVANSMLSTVSGVSAAGANPQATLMTPNLDGRMITEGPGASREIPLSPLGCISPCIITWAALELCGIKPILINAGLVHTPDFPCIDLYGAPSEDPRFSDAVADPQTLYRRGLTVGRQLGQNSDLLILGESVPGGTTTAMCVMNALGYNVRASSSFPTNPVSLKEEICRAVLKRMDENHCSRTDAFEVMRYAGDPMMPAACGVVKGFREANEKAGRTGHVILSGGTQMLSVCALIKALGEEMPPFVTTEYVRNDKAASIETSARLVGAQDIYVNPHFEDIGVSCLERYCSGEVKEGTLFGGSILLASMTGHSENEIRSAIVKCIRDTYGDSI